MGFAENFHAFDSRRILAAGVTRAPARGPEPIAMQLSINGTQHMLNLKPRVTLLDALRDRLHLTGTKKGTQTAISIAIEKIIASAFKAQKPISIEFLDFAKKKAQLSYASPGRQRMLSAFAYTRFAQTVGARAHDAGIEVVEVQAAYSSKIGAQKYARRYGLSVHRAAAFVLARRA